MLKKASMLFVLTFVSFAYSQDATSSFRSLLEVALGGREPNRTFAWGAISLSATFSVLHAIQLVGSKEKIPKRVRIVEITSLGPEIKWELVRELRSKGWRVVDDAPVEVRVELIEKVGARVVTYLCLVYLVEVKTQTILAQGKGERDWFYTGEFSRIEKKKEALIEALRSLY